MNWEMGHIANATGRESNHRLSSSVPLCLCGLLVFLPSSFSRFLISRLSRVKTPRPFFYIKNPDGYSNPSDEYHARNCTKLELTTPNASQRQSIQSFCLHPPAPDVHQAASRQIKVDQGKTSQIKVAREKINHAPHRQSALNLEPSALNLKLSALWISLKK